MFPATYLLVEGKDDYHLIKNLAKRHGIESLAIKDVGNVDELLDGLTLRLQSENLQVLGIVADADENISSRWLSFRDRLNRTGYADLPEQPPPIGWISSSPNLPRVGVWLMPDNQLPGMLEDFAAFLIPSDDPLRPKAEAVLRDIEQAGLNRYKPVHHPKALIHTWLAWQEPPGMPMGLAVTATALRHDTPTAKAFVDWLKRLFDLSPEQ